MARNVESGVMKTLNAKLRERGMSEDAAAAMAAANAAAAMARFQSVLAKQGNFSEEAYEKALADLRTWAQTL